MTAQSMTATEWLLLILLSVLWGASFFFAEVALEQVPPFTLVLFRVGIAALALHLWLRASGARMPADWAAWRRFATMGLLNNAFPFSLIVFGQTYIPSGLAAILNATTPLFAVVFAHFLAKDERLTLARLSGVGIGIAGVAVMIGPSALDGLGSGVIGQLAVLGGACCYGLASYYGRRLRGYPPVVSAAGQVTCSTLWLAPLALFIDRPWTLPSLTWETWGSLLGVALLSTALAYVVFFRIMARAGGTNVMLVTFLVPVSALLLGVFILGEAVGARELTGMALIFGGLAAIDGRLWRWLQSRLSGRRPKASSAP
jgi:drug/metabolite transporter (DMT)-like permease